MSKVYVIYWGFQSCLDGGSDTRGIYSTYEKAENAIKEVRNIYHKGLKEKKPGFWSDGDYWISIVEEEVL